MGVALSYAADNEERVASLTVGHGPGAPAPFELGMMINMLAKVGVMRSSTAALGAGPTIAFSVALGAIRHQANPTQIDDYKTAYAGRAFEFVHWFTDFHDKAAELAARVGNITTPTQVFWGEHDVLFKPSNAQRLHDALPNSALRLLPDAGHLSWSDQPEMFAGMISDWVNSGHVECKKAGGNG